METAVLYHLLGWQLEKSNYRIASGVSLNQTEGTKLETLYEKLCDSSIEMQGEYFSFPSHLLISDEAYDESFPFFGGPDSVVSRVSNLIVMCTSYPLGFSRLISSKDGFSSAWISTVAYERTPQMDILFAYPDYVTVNGTKTGVSISITNEYFPVLDEECLGRIRTCWDNLEHFHEIDESKNHRVENALGYFFYSWRAYHMEHVCLNLAIVLETLFSPASHQELSHSIAFNVSKLCARNRDESELLYRKVKKFYNLRSQIVHGGEANQKLLHQLTPDMFQLVARILREILLNESLLTSFGCKRRRSKLLADWMFGK